MEENKYKTYHSKISVKNKNNKKFFAISDIHGHLTELNKLLEQWNTSEQTLVLLGDYVDRGPDSKGVLDRIFKLKEVYKDKVIILLGNHDDSLLICFEKLLSGTPYSSNITEYETLIDFINKEYIESLTDSEMKNYLIMQLTPYVNLLQSMELYHQEGRLLFTHAGYNVELENWKDTTREEFLWIRRHYVATGNKSLVNVFGHTPGNMIIGHRNPSPYVNSTNKNFIGIDGGIFDYGRLNAIVIDEEGVILDYFYCRNELSYEKVYSFGGPLTENVKEIIE